MNYNTLGFGIGVGLGGGFVTSLVVLVTCHLYALGIYGLITTIIGAMALFYQSYKIDKDNKEGE